MNNATLDKKNTQQKTGSAKAVVLDFLDALNAEDFATARSKVDDNMVFRGVMGSRDGADAYFKDMQKMKFKYSTLKAFADGDDVSVFYDIDMGSATIFAAGWYHLKSGKIDSIKVLFDPRPLLDAAPKKQD